MRRLRTAFSNVEELATKYRPTAKTTRRAAMLATARGRWRRKKRRRRLRLARRRGGFFARNGLFFVLAHRLPPFAPAGLAGVRSRRRLRSKVGGKLGIQHFHVALPAQVGEPIVEQLVDLLLQQDFLNARRNLIERRNGYAGRVLRQQRVVVVGFNLLRGDLNALPEALLNEAQNLQPVAEIGLDALGREPMRSQKSIPSRIGGAVLADADGQFRADLMQARIDLLLRGLDGFDVLLADLLLDQGPADQLLKRLLPRDLDLDDRGGIENESRISSSRSLARMTCLLTTATARSRTRGDAEESVVGRRILAVRKVAVRGQDRQ